MFCPHSGKAVPYYLEFYAYNTERSGSEKVFIYIMLCLIFIFIILFIAALIIRIINFSQELKYINSEIRRTYGEEKKYWISQRKRLWLSLFLMSDK